MRTSILLHFRCATGVSSAPSLRAEFFVYRDVDRYEGCEGRIDETLVRRGPYSFREDRPSTTSNATSSPSSPPPATTARPKPRRSTTRTTTHGPTASPILSRRLCCSRREFGGLFSWVSGDLYCLFFLYLFFD
ncbi:hypothetical protein B0H16DRAFT_1558327 [Mycena metata]|uniref:Uncharacterized protein n=1 Tax=Mycena metata TaxID=1033252 RepID=A0AAD7IKG0_9AGAR|nr:hypothetical protein B0H16DRAFT_1558327 [Mycena metata]